MAKNGLITEEEKKKFEERESLFLDLASAFANIVETEDRTAFNNALFYMTKLLHDAAEDGNALHSIKIERQCIAIEEHLKGIDSESLRKQISRSGAAELFLNLVQNTERYCQHVNMLFPEGIKDIPEGEGMHMFVGGQIAYLNRGLEHFHKTEDARRNYYLARQANLKAGLKHYQGLQERALFPDRVAAKAEAQKIVGENGRVFRADPKGTHCYKGEILAITETHAIQRYSKSAVYIHARKDFPEGKQPSIGENLALHYTDGKITSVEHIQPKSQARPQQKDLGR